MGNVCWSNCSLLLFVFISTISAVSSLQITSNTPFLHVGKLVSKPISNVKPQSIPLEEVDYRTAAYEGRKMKSVIIVKKAMAQKISRDEEDGEKLVRISSAKHQNHVNVEEEDGKEATMADERKGGEQLKSSDMNSFVSYADYPSPHHHPPKNN